MKTIIISVLFLLNVLLCYNILQLRKATFVSSSILQRNKDKQMTDSIYNNVIKTNLFNQLENCDIKLNNIVIENFNTKTFKLNELFKKKAKMVFMFTELNCQTCVDMQLPNLEKLSNDIGSENIILLASYENKRDLLEFKRINKIRFEIYKFNKNDIKLPIIENNVPFFFILPPDLTSTCFFMPEKTLPELTITYFSIIKHKYFGDTTNK